VSRSAVVVGDLQIGITGAYPFAAELVPRAAALAAAARERVLRCGGVDTLVLAGVATSAMVAATVYDAADRDYRVQVAGDVCADPVQAVHDFLIGTLFPARGVDILTAT
jgi:isochorismate hydrolase